MPATATLGPPRPGPDHLVFPNPRFSPRLDNMWRQPVGEVIHSPRIMSVTKEEALSFAARFDRNPLHSDEAYAQSQGLRGVSLAGSLIGAISVRLVQALGAEIPAEAATHEQVVLASKTDERLLKPCYPGDVFRVASTKETQRVTSKGDRGVVMSRLRMYNQDDQLVYSCVNTLLVSLTSEDLEVMPPSSSGSSPSSSKL